MIAYSEGENSYAESFAADTLRILLETYPNHPWATYCNGGVMFIKHLGFQGPYGMAIRLAEADFDAMVWKRKVIIGAGEWLERAGIRRGANIHNDDIGHVEGIPDKWQRGEGLRND